MNQMYTVKAGDTLYGISNQFGVSVLELAKLNNVIGTNIKVGQVLIIPSASGTNPNNMFMYTVKAGDTLYSIAQKYGTTVKAIQDLNYLKNNNLTIGQVIRIPEMYTPEDAMMLPSYINYIVKAGDTLYSIGRENNVSVDTLIKDNGLTSNNLTIGQNLRIRSNQNMSEEIEECFGPDYIPPATSTPTTTYTVKSGDSLYSIAKKFNTSVTAIQNLNNLTNNNLSVGQQLKIPYTSSQTPIVTTYTVKSGDNLYAIARKFNTTVDSIKRKNNLTSNLLSVGQKLTI